MGKPWYFLISLLMLALFIPTVHAEAFTTSISDDSVKIELSYPTEVKPSTCFSVRVKVTALTHVSNLDVCLKVVYHRGTSVVTLYSGCLVTSFDGGPGLVYSDVLTLCSPSTLGTFVSAKVEITYTTGSLVQEFYMASVRSKYYSEVVAELESAKSTISILQSEVSTLKSIIDTLKLETSKLKDEVSKLNEMIKKLSLENELLKYKLASAETLNAQLKERLSKLEAELASVRKSYLNLSSEYAVLQDRYDSLLKSEESLRQRYETLSSNYNLLSKDYTMLTALYNELKNAYKDLQLRYEEALKKVGSLQESLKESEKEYEALSQQYFVASWERTVLIWVAIAQAAGIAGFALTKLFGHLKKTSGKEPSRESEKAKETGQKSESEIKGADKSIESNPKVETAK
ncbi:MAG: hypothetical protein RMJ14_05855 [Nitrososphaerota archaeon]|nr:hypothetical protein [Aigarchaeota archaeon]MDW8077138.1 hypothetical protein [Nitrososphaerota archaeon]